MAENSYISGGTLRAFRRDSMGIRTSPALAEALGVNPHHYTKLERGVYGIDKRTALAVLWIHAHGDPGEDGEAAFAAADGEKEKRMAAPAEAAALESLAITLYGQVTSGRAQAPTWNKLRKEERDRFRAVAQELVAEQRETTGADE